jgi:hypothetical protein
MPYYMIRVKLNKTQQHEIVNAMQNGSHVSLTFKPSQLNKDDGDMMLFTKRQIDKIQTALLTKRSVIIVFSKAQVRLMHEQVGSGILDSIGGFFKNTFNSVKNWVSNKIAPTKAPTAKDRYFEMKKMEQKNKVPTNKDLAAKYENLTNKFNYNPKPTPRPDYGIQYDDKPRDFKPPQPSTFDKVATKFENFDKMLNNIFSY